MKPAATKQPPEGMTFTRWDPTTFPTGSDYRSRFGGQPPENGAFVTTRARAVSAASFLARQRAQHTCGAPGAHAHYRGGLISDAAGVSSDRYRTPRSRNIVKSRRENTCPLHKTSWRIVQTRWHIPTCLGFPFCRGIVHQGTPCMLFIGYENTNQRPISRYHIIFGRHASPATPVERTATGHEHQSIPCKPFRHERTHVSTIGIL